MKLKELLFEPFTLPCGVILKNRLIKSAMSDSLGDGTGHPSHEQINLYRRWAEGGVSASIVGEVQFSPSFAENPGNLLLNEESVEHRFRALARAGKRDQTHLWLQLGHAGALAYPPISTPKGPSKIELPELSCSELSLSEIQRLPFEYAKAAELAQRFGFGGVQIHAAHGFLLSQFLSPLFNRRLDEYGGKLENRLRLLIEIVEEVRRWVGPSFPVAVKINSSDELEGGLEEYEALATIAHLENTTIDLIEISGGTYFPGVRPRFRKNTNWEPYFLAFAHRARVITQKPLMITGGIKTPAQALASIASGVVDFVGIARGLVLEPELPKRWEANDFISPSFPNFDNPPEGALTAWFTTRMSDIGSIVDLETERDLQGAVSAYRARNVEKKRIWQDHFFSSTGNEP